ncbi:hypothetical protein J2X55_002234 [Microbacterium sp. 1154]|uniref:hypothetical protein n=1 Tax=Microbacterium sp. 1154 TaxID=2817733 RepID=UPI00285F3DF1|nr:hypothetical protein [Microbacterium sp. 1154]MDR6691322.1 hypothetical protein [Microbacterium sp. 1154]
MPEITDPTPGDRSAWLELPQNRDDIQYVIGGNADAYWAEMEKTTAWAVFILGRRIGDVGLAFKDALLGSADKHRPEQ